MVRVATAALLFVSLASTVFVAPAFAQDPKEYGGGLCHDMVQSHDMSSLWVGRFIGMGDTAATREVACFTDHKQCIAWVGKASDHLGIKRIVQMSCHLGG